MKTSVVGGIAALAFAAGVSIGWSPQQATPGGSPTGTPPPVDPRGAEPVMTPEMQAWIDFGTPGPQHAALAKQAGNWKVTAKWWDDPGTPPSESEMTSAISMSMGGRYLVERTTGVIMGIPFEGMGITGYNNGLKQYESAWIDSMATAVTLSTGQADTGGTLNWASESYDPVTKTVTKDRIVERHLADGSMVKEMFKTGPDGKEERIMELTYTRVKAPGAAAPGAPKQAQ